MSQPFVLRIATRSSNLALWQSHHVADLVREAARVLNEPVTVELVPVSTIGDRDQSEPLRQFGGLGVFTREVQSAVLDGRADVAVHSLKDLPTEPITGLVLAATPARGLTADALVMPSSHKGPVRLSDLPHNARVGTGSPRRQAQLKHLRPDLQLSEVRGNVETRLRKLDEGQYDALVLASAGLTRLGLGQRISVELTPPEMFHAVGQGAVGVECRADDERTRRLLAAISDADTLSAVTAERSVLSTLRAGCHAPLGVASRVTASNLEIEAVLLSLDGTGLWHAAASGVVGDAVALGQHVAERLIAQGADRVLHGA